MRKVGILTYNTLHIDDKIYYFANNFNALLRYDIKERKNELVDKIPEEYVFSQDLISQLISWKNDIVCIPLNAKKIWIYDLDKNKWKGIEIEHPDINGKFMKAVIYKDEIFFVPLRYSRMLCIEMNSGRIDYIELGSGIELNEKNDMVWFRSDIAVIEDTIYAACRMQDDILCFNMRQKKYDWRHLDTNVGGYSGIIYDGRRFWIAARENMNSVFMWDGANGLMEVKIQDSPDGYIRGITMKDKKIIVRKTDRSIVIAPDCPNEVQSITEPYFFYENDKIIRRQNYSGLYSWGVGNQIESTFFFVRDDEKQAFISDKIQDTDVDAISQCGIMIENTNIGLSDFLTIIIHKREIG